MSELNTGIFKDLRTLQTVLLPEPMPPVNPILSGILTMTIFLVISFFDRLITRNTIGVHCYP